MRELTVRRCVVKVIENLESELVNIKRKYKMFKHRVFKCEFLILYIVYLSQMIG